MPDGTLLTPGATIRRALDERGLAVEDLAQSTRLRHGLLEQMMSDDFVETGGDVYARGHLRTIASVLLLDPEELLAACDAVPEARRPPAP